MEYNKRYIIGFACSSIEHEYFETLLIISRLFRELDEEIQENVLREFIIYMNSFKTHLLQ